MITFKEFLDEDGPIGTMAPTAGGPGAAPAPTGTAPAAAPSGQNNALQQQSSSLGQQIQQLNTKMQKLMQQKAALDKQIGTAASTSNQNTNNAVGANQATMAATQGAPGQ